MTGATGAIGWNLTRLLAGRVDLRVLVRDPQAAAAVLPAGVQVFRGDLTVPSSLAPALAGVGTVFHAAGLPEQWVRDPAIFERVNVQGASALYRATLAAGVAAFVDTSTIDIFRQQPGALFDESELESQPLGTHYERSKASAFRALQGAIADGLPARSVHPGAVFGPSPSRTPGVNTLLYDLARGRLPLLPPGGMPLVFAADLAPAFVQAAFAPVGSRFILSDRLVALSELAWIVRGIRRRGPRPLVGPLPAARLVSRATEALARVTRRPPLLPDGQLYFLTARSNPDAARARTELGWSPTPLPEAIATTLADLLAAR